MSLSKNIRKSNGKEESWHKYEMESFESYKSQKQGGKNDFVSLETEALRKPKFVPLEAWENAGNKEKETEDDFIKLSKDIFQYLMFPIKKFVVSMHIKCVSNFLCVLKEVVM